jgi:uncharacterized RDD family membrane protein YckC
VSWGEELQVETPEQIDLGMALAGPGSRGLAQVVDWLVKLLMLLVLGVFALLVWFLFDTPSTEAFRYVMLAFLLALAFVVVVGYDIYFEGYRHGQTPGKKELGIRVVRDSGGPIDGRAAAIRNLVGFADFLPFFYIGGGVIALLNRRGQRLGDMAAGTVVIRADQSRVPKDRPEPAALAQALPASAEFQFTRIHLAGCSPNDRHVLESYFQRRNDLNDKARGKLMRNLLHIFLDKTKYEQATPFDTDERIEAFLAALFRDLSRAT